MFPAWLPLTVPDPSGDVDVPTSWWDSVSIGEIIVGILAIVAILTLLWKGGRAFGRVFKAVAPLENFLRDWNGEEARPGVPARPGMMLRVERIENHLADAPTRAEFADLQKQVTRNTAVLDLLTPSTAVVTTKHDAAE